MVPPVVLTAAAIVTTPACVWVDTVDRIVKVCLLKFAIDFALHSYTGAWL